MGWSNADGHRPSHLPFTICHLPSSALADDAYSHHGFRLVVARARFERDDEVAARDRGQREVNLETDPDDPSRQRSEGRRGSSALADQARGDTRISPMLPVEPAAHEEPIGSGDLA